MRLLSRLVKHEIVTGSGIYLVASSVSASIPFVLLPILTRYLTPTEYGEVAMFTVLISLFSAFCGLSVNGAANRKYFDFREERSKLAEYIFMCTVILLFSSLALFIVVLVLEVYISQFLELSSEWIILAVPVSALSFLIKLRLGQWQVDKKPINYGVFQICQSVLNAGLSIFFVVILHMGVSGRIYGILIATTLFSLFAFYLLAKDKLLKITWKPQMANEAVRFGVPLIPHVLGMFLITSVDRIVITSKLGLADAGIYMVAIQLSLAVNLILTAVNQTFVPWLFERLKLNIDSKKIIIVKVTYGYYTLLSVGVVLGFWIGDDILRILVGSDYFKAAELIAWVILGQAFHGGYLMVTNYLFYAKRTGVLSGITISLGLLNVLLLFVLIHEFGILGAVWAFCISKFIQWLITWYVANKIIKMPWLLRASI